MRAGGSRRQQNGEAGELSSDKRERDGLNDEATAALRWLAGALLVGGLALLAVAILA